MATTICIPEAKGVPGFSGQPPYWLPGHPTFPQKTNLDDPRWRGAYRRNYNGDVAFRALHHTEHHGEDSDKSLYLSWHALFVPELDDANDRLYVGFRPNGESTAMVIQIHVHGTPTAQTAAHVDGIDVFTLTAGTWTSATPPAWIDDNTRVWVDPSGPDASGSYAVQMRVPEIDPIFSRGADALNLGDEFDLWFFLVGGAPVPGVVPLVESPALGTTLLDLNDHNYPDPAGWDHVSTVPGDAACPTEGGVVLTSVDVGTTNTPSSRILFDPDIPSASRPVNTFFARPRNYTDSAISAGGITARFRIANWGSIAAPAAWVDIPGGGAVSSASDIPGIDSGTPPPATNPISFNWKLSDADISNFITGSTPHKCILVELDGPDLVFFNESVYRNMNFVEASTFRREAEISVVGLDPVPGGASGRDVYLAVEMLNMPARAIPEEEPKPQGRRWPPDSLDERNAAGGTSRERLVERAKNGQLREEEIQRFMPTYRVHVYHDTGHRVEGRSVLRPQTYFGYFVEHEGPLEGWRHHLQAPPEAQLQEIAENFYKIAVPNGGVASVTTTVEAVERGGCLKALVEFIQRIIRSS